MKKVGKILLIVWAILATILLVLSCVAFSESAADYNELKELYFAVRSKYDEVVTERDALLEKVEYLENAGEPSPENSSEVSHEPSAKPTTTPVAKFDEEKVLSQLEVTEYSYNTTIWQYAFMTIKNNSEYEIKISAAAKFYNANDELIGAESADERPVAPGAEIILYFMPDEKYARMEYELSVDEDKRYESAVFDLSYESTSAKEKEIVSVTNNGSEAADFVQCYALFFLGDQIVGYDSSYFTDDDYELKPGKTITKEFDCYNEYDSVKFFFTGRRYK